MPNTLIRHGWIDSERIDRLTPDAERFFLRLMLNADDAGRFDGRAEILRARLFPLKIGLRVPDVEAWRERCLGEGLVSRWEWEGKAVLQIMRFQRRSPAKVSKYPNASGVFEITYVKRSTSDGLKEFVATSIPAAVPMGGARDAMPLPGFIADSPETESGTETKTESQALRARGDDGGWMQVMLANEESRTLPKLIDTGEFRAAWLRWVRHLFERKGYGRRPSLETVDAHLALLEQMGPADALRAIAHSILADGGQPRLPDERGTTNGRTHHANNGRTAQSIRGPSQSEAKLA